MVLEWADPTVAGHTATAEALLDMPFVQNVLNQRIRADYPKMSLTKVDDKWYALDNTRKLWTVTADFVRCQQPPGGYEVVHPEWKSRSPVFTAATNAAPYPSLPGQPGCNPNVMMEGDLLHVIGTSITYASFGYGQQGEPVYRGNNLGGMAYCLLENEVRIFDIDDATFQTYHEEGFDERTCPDTPEYRTGILVLDTEQNAWEANTPDWNTGEAFIIQGQWMKDCVIQGDHLLNAQVDVNRAGGPWSNMTWRSDIPVRLDYCTPMSGATTSSETSVPDKSGTSHITAGNTRYPARVCVHV